MELDESLQTGVLREKTLEVAKRHKASWIELGQYLYTIYKNKHYKDWGFMEFETYCGKELKLKQATAIKLLKSYYFLEKEEPHILRAQNSESEEKPLIPNYESINVLRLAKNNKKLTPANFTTLRKTVFDESKEPRDVKVQVRKMLSDHEVKNPQEVRADRRNAMIKRLINNLRNSFDELEAGKLLPAYLLKQIDELALKLEDQLAG